MSKGKQIRETIGELLELPKEMIYDLPRLIMIGTEKLLIENHKSVISYNENDIKLKMASGDVLIQGVGLEMREITEGDIIIEGKIVSISFDN